MEFYYHEVDEDVLILSADGGLSRDTAQEFLLQLEKLVDSGLRKIIVDCSKLDYISSYGLSVLVRLHGRMAKHGGDVKLAGLSGVVMQVMQIAQLDKLLDIYPDVERARLAFRPKETS